MLILKVLFIGLIVYFIGGVMAIPLTIYKLGDKVGWDDDPVDVKVGIIVYIILHGWQLIHRLTVHSEQS